MLKSNIVQYYDINLGPDIDTAYTTERIRAYMTFNLMDIS